MTARERFQAALDEGKQISALAFTGSFDDFSNSDRAWLARQVRKGSILKACGGYPFFKPIYASPQHWVGS